MKRFLIVAAIVWLIINEITLVGAPAEWSEAEVKSYLVKALDYSINHSFFTDGIVIEGRALNADFRHFSGDDGATADRFSHNFGDFNGERIFLRNNRGVFLWMEKDGAVMEETVVQYDDYNQRSRIFDPVNSWRQAKFYTKFDFCRYTAQEASYQGKPCVKITVTVPFDDDIVAQITGTSIDDMDQKRKDWLRARILSVMEFWIGDGDTPFIYKNFYHNQLKFWHTDIEWGNIRAIPYSAKLANPPEDCPITVVSSDDELREIFKGVYTENFMSEVASPYTLKTYKIVLLVVLAALVVALAGITGWRWWKKLQM